MRRAGGHIVVTFAPTPGFAEQRALLLSGDVKTAIDLRPGLTADAVNDGGQIVGGYIEADDRYDYREAAKNRRVTSSHRQR